MKNKSISLYYIAELNLPNKSAYSIHVMKMCEAFSKLGYEINLLSIKNTNLSRIFNIKKIITIGMSFSFQKIKNIPI